jgi:hypothetical protein
MDGVGTAIFEDLGLYRDNDASTPVCTLNCEEPLYDEQPKKMRNMPGRSAIRGVVAGAGVAGHSSVAAGGRGPAPGRGRRCEHRS